jgi:WD40 repeat protein
MGRLRSGQLLWVLVPFALFLGGCGGNKPPGASPFVARITLAPATSASLQLGGILGFTATAQNGSGSNITPGFTFVSSDTSVLTISPGGVACAGTWNAPLYTICTPAGVGTVQVTAAAQGATSPPTLVFVHPPIDNIQVSVVPQLNSPPPACPAQVALPEACSVPFNKTNCTQKTNPKGQPYFVCGCLSQNQVQNLQATAYSQGNDITSSVGPFTWSVANIGAVTLTPIIDPTLNVATNQATATPNTPGQTEVFASASGVSSDAYPFETCPVQCITLQVGTQPTGPTSFVVNKGTSETITSTAVDVQGCIVPKPSLTWTSSQPASILAGSVTSGCAAGIPCNVTTPQAGAASITASCTPPTCNVGFPLNPLNLPPPFIPQPVYPVTAISGLATPATSSGTASTFNVLATSLDCASNAFCTVALYDVSSGKNVAGSAIQLPAPPNSLIVDPGGDKAYLGSQYGAALVSTAGLGGTSAFTALPAAATPTGKVTGRALATSPNGNFAIFSDTVSTPNQVYVVNAASASPTSTALNISGATTAAFSPDGLKAFIIACVGPVPCTAPSGNTLYVYSALQALQSIPLSFPADAVVFSSSGTFALVSGGTPTAASAIAVNTCDNSTKSLSLVSTLTGQPVFGQPLFLKMVPAANVLMPQIPTPDVSEGLDFFLGLDATGLDVIATNAMQPPFQDPVAPVCPQIVKLATQSQNPMLSQTLLVHIPFGHGTFNPIAFFLSPDNTQVYVVASDSGVLVYSFDTGSVSSIPLLNSITGATVSPVAADLTPDGTLLYVAASDGTLHQIDTITATDVTPQIGFPPIPNATNGFCVNGISPVSCTLNLVVMRP